LARAGKVAASPLIHRLAELSAVATAHALRLVRSSSVQYFLGGAACLAIWSVLWSLLVFAFVFPPGDVLTRQPRENPVAASVRGDGGQVPSDFGQMTTEEDVPRRPVAAPAKTSRDLVDYGSEELQSGSNLESLSIASFSEVRACHPD
jgi:hypothetical protein